VPQEKTEAVVLRGVDFSETSRVVTFLSPGRGRMACLARGARRKNSPLAAALDTFNRVELVYYWKDGRGVQNLGEVSVLDRFAGVKSDLARGAYGAFPLELTLRVAHENEPSAPLYTALVRGLAGLAAWPGEPRHHACWQVLRLLAAAGFAPELDRCGGCGGALTGRVGFSAADGARCGGCRGDFPLSVEALSAMRALLGAAVACPEAGSAASVEVFRALRRYAAYQLETDFRSLRVLDEVVGTTPGN